MSYIKSKNTACLILFIFCLYTTIIHAEESNLKRLANKMVPNQAKNIVFERIIDGTDFFVINHIESGSEQKKESPAFRRDSRSEEIELHDLRRTGLRRDVPRRFPLTLVQMALPGSIAE